MAVNRVVPSFAGWKAIFVLWCNIAHHICAWRLTHIVAQSFIIQATHGVILFVITQYARSAKTVQVVNSAAIFIITCCTTRVCDKNARAAIPLGLCIIGVIAVSGAQKSQWRTHSADFSLFIAVVCQVAKCPNTRQLGVFLNLANGLVIACWVTLAQICARGLFAIVAHLNAGKHI